MREIIKQINPRVFNVKEIKISKFRKIKVGESHVNYLLEINKKNIMKKNTGVSVFENGKITINNCTKHLD